MFGVQFVVFSLVGSCADAKRCDCGHDEGGGDAGGGAGDVDGGEVATVSTPPAMVGRTLEDIGATAAFGVLVVRVIRNRGSGSDPEVIMPPIASTKLEADDELTVVGSPDAVRLFAAGSSAV